MKYIIIILALITAAVLLMVGCSSKVPENLGMKDGLFSKCPEDPNCVSSQATDVVHKIDPIAVNGAPDKVLVDLQNAIESIFGGKVVEIKGNYLRAEFTSRVMRFTDDLECFYDEENGLIQVRSAARIGYTDFNVNRKRVEKLRSLLQKKQ